MLKFLDKKILAVCLLFSANAFAEINIAVIAPMDGHYKVYGNEIIQGAETAVNEINANGGLNGRKVNLIKIEDPCNDYLSLTTAQMLALTKDEDYRVHMVLGHFCQNAAGKIAETYAKAKIIQIAPVPVSGESVKTSYDGFIRFSGHTEQQARDFFKFFEKTMPDSKFAVIYDDKNTEDIGIVNALQKEFARVEKQDRIVAFNYSTDLGEIVNNVIASEARAVFIMGSPQNITDIAKVLKRGNDNLFVFVNKYHAKKQIAKSVGDEIYFISLPSLKDNPNFAENLVRMRLLGVEPEGLMVYSYLATRLWQGMVEKAGSFDYDKVAKAVNGGTAIATGWGNVTYTKGRPNKSINYRIYRQKNGDYAQVH